MIVNDHDPTLFRYQTEAIWPDRFSWHVFEEGPEMWHVRIGRPVAS